MEHRLIIEKFGKIERAEIAAAPFTLFVGDNNSGKSYLLSLLWGIYSADEASVLFWDLKELRQKAYEEIYEKIYHLLQNAKENQKQELKISSLKLLEVLNAALKKNKDRFVSGIFNSEQVSIQGFFIEMQEESEVVIESWKEENRLKVSFIGKNYLSFSAQMVKTDIAFAVSIVYRNLLLWLLKGGKQDYYGFDVVYLPAARTGFMLAKNVINKVGRRAAYDMSGFHGLGRKDDMESFTKPIIHFLDTLEGLSLEHKAAYGEIAAWMEQEMVHGNIQYGSEANEKEIRYIPEGSEVSLPLRAASAVVTELTPLLLLLKYRRRMGAICYEEPEMCLHPQLQQEMGRLLIRLVNNGISMIATTHSDIIIQHINNMCKLKELGAPKELMKNQGLVQEDLISMGDVAIYQFKDKGNHSVVGRVLPIDGEFKVETFTNALMKILEQTSEVQDFEGE